MSDAPAQPFLKWVGGKAQLLAQFEPFFPARVERYVEPFLGGGAVFFHLRHRFPAMRARLCDNNAELINAYAAVRDAPEEVMLALDAHRTAYLAAPVRYYYEVRGRHGLPPAASVERAARMIFLNKTCFNGLWRVNSRGEFNVPIGSPKTRPFYDRGNLLAVSAALRGVELGVREFQATLREAAAGDFVYVDPPYIPLSRTARFTAYTKEEFGPREQQELALLAAEAAARGVRVMLSNSDTPSTRELYGGFDIRTVRARRVVNRVGSKRGAISELVVSAGAGLGSQWLDGGAVSSPRGLAIPTSPPAG